MAWEEFEQTFGAAVQWKNLQNARFEACTFNGVNWSNADLRGARFEECLFVACDWSNARVLGTGLQSVVFRECKLVGVDFETMNPLGFAVEFDRCNVDAANFSGKNLQSTAWKQCSAMGADFTSANAEGVVFDRVDLADAVFHQTKLRGADFRTAENWRISPVTNALKGAKFQRAAIDGLLGEWGVELE